MLRSSKRAVRFERGGFTYLAYLASPPPEDCIPGADKLCQAQRLHLFYLVLNTNLFAGCSVFKHGCLHSKSKQILLFPRTALPFVILPDFDRVTSSCPLSSQPPDCQVHVGELCSSRGWPVSEQKTKQNHVINQKAARGARLRR